MEALHTVRDGSTGSYVPGYMTMECVALTRQHKVPLPIYEKVYSPAEADFINEDEEVLTLLRLLSERYGHSGVRVLDRGFDANAYIEHFASNKERFVMRVKATALYTIKANP